MLVDLIRLAKPWIGEDEQRAVAAVLQSGQIAQGALVRRFEHAVAALTGREHGVAVSSGTAALQLALQALGIGEGSEVLCPALTWPSPAHAIALARADVRFVEVDPNEWNSTGEELAAARTTRSRAAIVIDQFGNPARDSEIRALLGDLPLIEDAACALGSRFAHEPCGSLGEVACLSFHPRKIITTGEGGICLTDDLAVANRLRALRDHGRLDGTFLEAAGNFRMTEVAAALGLTQLQRLDEILDQRRLLARRYRTALADRVDMQATPEGAESNYQTLGAILPPGYDRDTVIGALARHGVEAGRLSYAVHELGTCGAAKSSLPNVERIAARGIALPLFAQMRVSEVDEVVEALLEVLDGR